MESHAQEKITGIKQGQRSTQAHVYMQLTLKKHVLWEMSFTQGSCSGFNDH